MRELILADPVITALLSVYQGAPAVFTRLPVPDAIKYPIITISRNLSQQSEDGVDDYRPIVSYQVAVHGRNDLPPTQYRNISDIAFEVRKLFHRKRNVTIPEWTTIDQRCMGPVDIVSTGEITTRTVNLTVRLAQLAPAAVPPVDLLAEVLALSPYTFYVGEPPYLGPDTGGVGVVNPGGAVGYMADLGTGNNPALQPVSGRRPFYQTDGSLNWIEGDGAGQFMASVAFAAIPQPFEMVMAYRALSVQGTTVALVASPSATGLYSRQQEVGDIFAFAGGLLSSGPASEVVGTDYVVTATFNGASSRITLDNAAYQMGDAGAGAYDGIGVLAAFLGNSSLFNARFYTGIVRPGLMTDDQIAICRAFCAQQQGRVL
jgi:hypothetical protein